MQLAMWVVSGNVWQRREYIFKFQTTEILVTRPKLTTSESVVFSQDKYLRVLYQLWMNIELKQKTGGE